MSVLSGGKAAQTYLEGIAKKIQDAGLLRVGFLENAKYDDGTPVAAVAAQNEYGTKESPSRPFFRTMIKDKKAGWAVSMSNLMQSTNYDIDAVYKLMGNGIVGQLQMSIRDGAWKPNSPVTNLLKQRFPMRENMTAADVDQAKIDVANGATAPAGKPLNWTAHMQNSAGWDIKHESA